MIWVVRLSISVKVFGVWGGINDTISHECWVVVGLQLSRSFRGSVINSTLSKRLFCSATFLPWLQSFTNYRFFAFLNTSKWEKISILKFTLTFGRLFHSICLGDQRAIWWILFTRCFQISIPIFLLFLLLLLKLSF